MHACFKCGEVKVGFKCRVCERSETGGRPVTDFLDDPELGIDNNANRRGWGHEGTIWTRGTIWERGTTTGVGAVGTMWANGRGWANRGGWEDEGGWDWQLGR